MLLYTCVLPASEDNGHIKEPALYLHYFLALMWHQRAEISKQQSPGTAFCCESSYGSY